MDKHIVHSSINIQATPAEIWDALTKPEKTKKYFFNCEVHSDWHVGDSITFTGKMFLVFNVHLQGEILEVIPGRLLRYSLNNDSDDEHSTTKVTIRISNVKDATVLDVTDDVGIGDGAARRYKRSVKGWHKILNGMKKMLEKNT